MNSPSTHQLAQTGHPRATLGSPPHSFILQPDGSPPTLDPPSSPPHLLPLSGRHAHCREGSGKIQTRSCHSLASNPPMVPEPRPSLQDPDSYVAGEAPPAWPRPASILSTSILPLTGSFLRPLLPDVCIPGPCPPERLCPRSSSARSTLPTKTQAGSLPSPGQAKVSPREAFPEHLIYTAGWLAGWPRLQLRVGIKIC